MQDFASQVDEVVKNCERPSTFTPTAHYNKAGDCVEFIASEDRFYAERIDDLVTVYYSYETREIIGSLIKGIRRLCEQLTERCPGFAVEIQDGRVRLAHLLLARMWASDTAPTEPVKVMKYRKLVEVAERTNIDTEVYAIA